MDIELKGHARRPLPRTMKHRHGILSFLVLSIAVCASISAKEVGPISETDVIEAVKNGYSIVEARVERWKAAGKGTRNERVLYEITILDVLLAGDNRISKQYTYNYGELPLLEKRHYIMILMPGPFGQVEPLNGRARINEIKALISKEKNASTSGSP